MDNRPDIEKRVEKTLDSLDGIRKAEPQPFFFTRLKARLERDEKSWWETMGSFLAKPATVTASLVLILLFNAVIVFNQETKSDNPGAGQASTETMPESEIIAASNSSFDLENLDQ